VVLAGVQTSPHTENFVESPFKTLATVAQRHARAIYPLDGATASTSFSTRKWSSIRQIFIPAHGLTIPFAFALAALLARYPGEKWIHLTRNMDDDRLVLPVVGILLGATGPTPFSAGAALGLGSVENASLLPGSPHGFLHSVMMQEKRGMMKVWNVWLVFCTFCSAFLAPSLLAAASSVPFTRLRNSHIGPWFVSFLH